MWTTTSRSILIGTNTGSNVNTGTNMTRKKQTKTNVFVLSWDCNGLESIVPVSEIEARNLELEKQRMWAILQDQDPGDHRESIAKIIHRLTMRAQFNTQRHYEIYSVCVDASIDAEQLKDLFDQNPQGMADLIRERGNKIYSDRATRAPVIV